MSDDLSNAHSSLMVAVGALEMWQRRLRKIADHLPDPTLASPDDPPPVPTAVRERIHTSLDKRVGPAIKELREAASWLEDDVRVGL